MWPLRPPLCSIITPFGLGIRPLDKHQLCLSNLNAVVWSQEQKREGYKVVVEGRLPAKASSAPSKEEAKKRREDRQAAKAAAQTEDA